ncbi:MAG TPA: FtsQ-type POTRA domain-containing protein [Burkholderiaceae bacterium]|nr:FtsQ-type POTRA domain-containing protein [Burkholderiaceae bacterium]
MNSVVGMRWLTRALLAAAAAVGFGALVVWVAQRPRFDFRHIELSGDLRHVSRAQVRSAITGQLFGNFFTMRLADSRVAFETIPWVASASVRRVWPDRLVVKLIERRAVGTWSDGRVLSDAGLLFAANAAEAELDGAQVEFSGPPRFAAEAAERLQAFSGALRRVSTTVVAVAVSERASWSLRTGSGQTLELGRDDPPGSVQRRLAAIVANYPTVLAQFGAPPFHIDARYNNGFAVTRP